MKKQRVLEKGDFIEVLGMHGQYICKYGRKHQVSLYCTRRNGHFLTYVIKKDIKFLAKPFIVGISDELDIGVL